MDQQFFEANKDNLMPIGDFKKYKDKETKAALLSHWRKNYSDKEIRTFWKNMQQGNYYYHLQKLGLIVKKPKDEMPKDTPNLIMKEYNPYVIDIDAHVHPDTPPSRKTIEDSNSNTYYNFEFSGESVLLQRKFKSILALLEGEEGIFQVKIEIEKK
ncbi:hypothetical protein [Paenibacillus chitinolyticus]|uniref:hypothetical protein n=1 Tax=Paenibacillus chitinolyticus TaxID=79263 RepID=UPI001C481EE6|nr:hypothetical protein [Paenibacillus chitinolyticus]MBV6717271.1 hypothetical protein [Paenibacillus chitinolyticus]